MSLKKLKYHEVWVASLGLVLAVAVYAWLAVDFRGPPFEDAAMLMRYAEHLSQGHGIVWNVGEPPVDGATDFLFMAGVAGLIKSGVSTGRAVRVLGLLAHAITVLIVYWVNRRIWRADVRIALVTALYLALGTGLWYVAAFFGTTFFAMFAAGTWALGLPLIQTDEPPLWLPWCFAISGLLLGLARPEGVLLAVLMLVAVVLSRGWRRSLQIVGIFLGVMVVVGGVYFSWRWAYFGHPLPNPYYKKAAGILHWDSFWESLSYVLRFAGPFAVAFLLGFRSKELTKKTLLLAIPLLGFAALFILISNETNFGGRFQYAVLPLILLSYYPLVRSLPVEVRPARFTLGSVRARRVFALMALVLVATGLYYSAIQACRVTTRQPSCGMAYEADGRYDVGRQLSDYRDRGYIIATSEAGLLPLYSGWTAIDTWGLNDSWITQHGEITAEYLDQRQPHIIAFHAYFSPLIPEQRSEKDLANSWHRMTLILQDYARSRHYVLAAAFGDSPYESHYYYVRSDFPDSERIVRDIARMRAYYWYASGRKAFNYAGMETQENR